MKSLYFFYACFFGFLVIVYALEPVKSRCLEKEKALTLLETAENLLSKAEESFPSCENNLNYTDTSDCGGVKPLAYIEISKKLISDVRERFPTCFEPIPKVPIEEDDKIIQEVKHRDCSEILASGHNESGVYTIWTEESFTTGKSLQVYCDMDTDKGGWTVIQRRGKFPIQQDFYKGWESYKNGFGNLTEEFWLGNENIRVLCQKGCEIRFDLQDEEGKKGFALYQNFNLSGENYRIAISGYAGTVGDDMKYGNNLDFSTKDKGNIKEEQRFKSGWWHYFNGYYTNLNGFYQPGQSNYETVNWFSWRRYNNLAWVEIKVRRK